MAPKRFISMEQKQPEKSSPEEALWPEGQFVRRKEVRRPKVSDYILGMAVVPILSIVFIVGTIYNLTLIISRSKKRRFTFRRFFKVIKP